MVSRQRDVVAPPRDQRTGNPRDDAIDAHLSPFDQRHHRIRGGDETRGPAVGCRAAGPPLPRLRLGSLGALVGCLVVGGYQVAFRHKLQVGALKNKKKLY